MLTNQALIVDITIWHYNQIKAHQYQIKNSQLEQVTARYPPAVQSDTVKEQPPSEQLTAVTAAL